MSAAAQDKIIFRTNCCIFLASPVSKILERSPTKYTIFQAISCFVLGAIESSTLILEKKMGSVSQILYHRKWISIVVADKAKVQFSQLCFKASDEQSELFNKFNWNKDRRDTFYYDLIGSKRELCQLWSAS